MSFKIGTLNFQFVDNKIDLGNLSGISTTSLATSEQIKRNWDGLNNGITSRQVKAFYKRSGNKLKSGEFVGVAYSDKTINNKQFIDLRGLRNKNIAGVGLNWEHRYSTKYYFPEENQHDPIRSSNPRINGTPKPGTKQFGQVLYSDYVDNILWVRGIFYLSKLSNDDRSFLINMLRHGIGDLSIGYRIDTTNKYNGFPIIEIFELSLTSSGKNKNSSIAIVHCSENQNQNQNQESESLSYFPQPSLKFSGQSACRLEDAYLIE